MGKRRLVTHMTQPLSICFVALNSYSLFEQSNQVRHIGGAESQQYEMACYLRDQGHRVSFIVKDHGQPDEIQHDGITVYSAYQADAGLPVLRFFHPRWSSVARAMRRADADIYYQRSSGSETGQVALWCRSNKRKFVYGIASEGDCVPELPFISRGMDRSLFRFGLRQADRVVAQTARQAQLLQIHFGREATVIPNVIRPPESLEAPPRQQDTLLWVGRIAPVKRVEWIVALAKTQPHYAFRLVGGVNAESDYTRKLIDELQALPNVTLIPSMPRPRLFDEYRKASVLLLTSELEGFPNVFIEAWLCGTPVLSTFDPDQLVSTKGLGWIAQTQQALQERLAAGLFPSLDAEAAMRAHVAEYARRQHAPEQVLPRFEALLQTLAVG